MPEYFVSFQKTEEKMRSLLLLPVAFAVALSSAIPSDPLSDKDHMRGEDHDAKYDHEAFLGKDQAASYDQLSPEESKVHSSPLPSTNRARA